MRPGVDTVHEAPGSQLPRVFIPVTAVKLLDGAWLYPAITLAQTQVILVCDIEVARRATHAPPKAHGRRVASDLVLGRQLAGGQHVPRRSRWPAPTAHNQYVIS